MGSLTSRATLPPISGATASSNNQICGFFFSQQIFWIFGAPALEMHTITEYNSPDLWTFCKSYGGAQKRCVGW